MPIKWPPPYRKTTDRRQEWAALKKKHASAIKAGRVSFDAQLGSALGQFETAVKQVAIAHYGQTASQEEVDKLTQAGQRAAAVAQAYQARAAGLPQPAQAEFTAFLTAIATDAQVWAEAALAAPAPAAATNSPG